MPSDIRTRYHGRVRHPPPDRDPCGVMTMSIKHMMSLHPSAEVARDERRALAVHHTMYCAEMCNSCADACLAEVNDMTQCIRICLDCSDVCTATARVAGRLTGDGSAIAKRMLTSCGHACEICAHECERHSAAHCQLCAQICRECARDCQTALLSMH